jgi:hypothetical protein
VIQGAEGFTTPPRAWRSGFVDSIRAPRKAFVTIEEPLRGFMEASRFLKALKDALQDR